MRTRFVPVLIAGAVLAAGITFLALPVSADLSRGLVVDCGTGFSADTERLDLYARADRALDDLGVRPAPVNRARACDSALTDRRIWAWPLTGLGAAGLAIGVLSLLRRRPG